MKIKHFLAVIICALLFSSCEKDDNDSIPKLSCFYYYYNDDFQYSGTYTYDDGRIEKIAFSDGEYHTWEYSGSTVTVKYFDEDDELFQTNVYTALVTKYR